MGATLWRYMDLTKLLWLLDRKSLFFTRADKLSDPWEGSAPTRNREAYRTIFSGIVPKSREEQYAGFISRIKEGMRRHTYVSCWHQNECESAAMWKLYLQSEQGIAIRSNFERLRDALSRCANHSVFIGQVKYIDYSHETMPEGNTLWPFVHKRRSFEHEREVRAVIQEQSGTEGDPLVAQPLGEHGIDIPIDIELLIEKILIAPTSPSWVADLVKSLVERYGLNGRVHQSELAVGPLY
jgi:hypothetical protein